MEKDFDRISRESSHRDFLMKLQLEYLTQRLRSFIYKDDYARVASDISVKKREKIEELGAKFGIETIFSPEVNVRDFVEKNFWNPFGLPNFQYKDEEQKRIQHNYDCWYIFYRGSKVLYQGKEMRVLRNNPPKRELCVTDEFEQYIVTYNDITIKDDFAWL